jgi:3-oxoacyl-[acyl-carrier-protein] synthase-3
VITACRRGVEMLGIGSYAPERVMTNDELATRIDTSDEWIATRTGIRERRIASDAESAADLGTAAAERAIEVAGMDASELGLIVVATASPDYYFPATAALIGERLGAAGVPGYDLSAACTGFVFALAQAYGQVASGLTDTALVVGCEVFSRLLDWDDRSTCVLFGDGAGAVVLRGNGSKGGLLGFELGSNGQGGDLLKVAAAGHSRAPAVGPYVTMDGPQVYKFATTVSVESAAPRHHPLRQTVDDLFHI